jgi:pimeloyl-ACP methyl ester carboxylesterase
MPTVRAGAAELAYDAAGEGPAVLLLHAGVTDRRSWRPLIDHLGPGYRTIAYDQRGFGDTRYQPEPHDPVRDALAVLDADGQGSAVVIGASYGGRRSIDLALAHPDRVDALVLIAAGAEGGPEDDPSAFAPEVQARWHAYGSAEEDEDVAALERIEAHVWLDGWAAEEGRVQGPVRELFLAMNAIALHAPDIGPTFEHPPAWDRVKDIAVPTLVLCGDLDVVCRPASEHFARAIPGARLEVLEGTGHLPHLEGHERCLAAIAAFLEESTSPAPATGPSVASR